MKNTIAGVSLVLASSVNICLATHVYNNHWQSLIDRGDAIAIFGVVQFILGFCFFILAIFEKK